MKAALGALIVVAHAAGFAALAAHCHGTELAVDLPAGAGGPEPAVVALRNVAARPT